MTRDDIDAERAELARVEARIVALIAEQEALIARVHAAERSIAELRALNDAVQIAQAAGAERRGEKPH